MPSPAPVHTNAAAMPRTGIGLRAEHYAEFEARCVALPLVEVHSENCFRGGRHLQAALRARERSPVSLHGVGLSLGSSDALSRRHLASLKALVRDVEPELVSEHLCWTSAGGVHTHELLPLPYTREALAHVVRRIDTVQQALGRPLLIENLSSCLEYRASEMSEWRFLAQVVAASGCAVLLDLNNLYVNACNHGFDPHAYLRALPPERVHQFHLAGHLRRSIELDDGGRGELLIDTHSRPVCDAVWALYETAVRWLGPKPTIVEWDHELPPLPRLLAEAARADAVSERVASTRAEVRHAA